MSRNPSSHIGDGDLLRYADNELGSREAKQIESHLTACWQCRTELSELEQTISDCVRYRQKAAEALPEPPKQWFDIHRQFAEIDEAAERRPWPNRLWETALAIMGPPRRWAPALAVLLVFVLVVDQLRNTPSVRAAELLDKAVVAAESVPVGPRGIR
ncbi:MAG: hypothetical protein GY953_27875, partial [bacterium]|nr:hypothetical protein [bacterium]